MEIMFQHQGGLLYEIIMEMYCMAQWGASSACFYLFTFR